MSRVRYGAVPGTPAHRRWSFSHACHTIRGVNHCHAISVSHGLRYTEGMQTAELCADRSRYLAHVTTTACTFTVTVSAYGPATAEAALRNLYRLGNETAIRIEQI